tara:strand:- start:116493 stop:116987 length:495 start_codon:yes stop_codon:yes gene_type:complete
MNSLPFPMLAVFIVPLLLVGTLNSGQQELDRTKPNTVLGNPDQKQVEDNTMKVHYLEIVTTSVNETCDALAQAHGVVFSDPIPELGNARTANLTDGGRIGVRAPMRDTETPVVRPYILVDDINSAVKAAEMAGAKIAMPPMKIPDQGTFSIYILGGIEHGLWQI